MEQSPAIVQEFTAQGYLGPFHVWEKAECRRLLRAIKTARSVNALDWDKSQAAVSRTFYEAGTHPAIVNVVSKLLGPNVMLWGASIQSRGPGVGHPWHSDIESSPHTRKTVSVWIGLKNATRETSLMLVPGSHNFGNTIQEERHRRGVKRETAGHKLIEEWALEKNASSDVKVPEMDDGWALFFDGQLWHGSQNNSNRTRHALLLQYATPETSIRIPDFNSLDWPFTYLDLPRPPCIMIKGSNKGDHNRLEAPPVDSRSAGVLRLTNRAHRLDLPLASDEETGWKPYHLFNGTTPNISRISCHISSLASGKIPHPPHKHSEEEILLLLAGEVELLLPDLGPNGDVQRVSLTPGKFVYYPANFHHTLQTVGQEPANYLMFKWENAQVKLKSALTYGLFDANESMPEPNVDNGFTTHNVFEGPTACLEKLHCHASALTPGAGYDAHVDAHDVAIIVLSGEIESIGDQYGPNTVLYFPAGEPHGMRNPGIETARYLVFEFHGSNGAMRSIRKDFRSSFLVKLTDPARWKRKIKQLLSRVRS